VPPAIDRACELKPGFFVFDDVTVGTTLSVKASRLTAESAVDAQQPEWISVASVRPGPTSNRFADAWSTTFGRDGVKPQLRSLPASSPACLA
jgi:hypothetical protein